MTEIFPKGTNLRSSFYLTGDRCYSPNGPSIRGRAKNNDINYEVWTQEQGKVHRVGGAAISVYDEVGIKMYKEFWEYGKFIRKEARDVESEKRAKSILKSAGIRFYDDKELGLHEVLYGVSSRNAAYYASAIDNFVEPGMSLDLSGFND